MEFVTGNFNYSKGQLLIRAVIVFAISIFFFLALGTEIIDVAETYFKWEGMRPRAALALASVVYTFVILTHVASRAAGESGGRDIFSLTGIFLFFVLILLLVQLS